MDYARGIAIILVVYGHCFRGLREAGYFPADSLLSTVDYVIYGFHMPLFFFLSGVVSAKGFTLPAAAFLRGRVTAILWPYLLWMSVELFLLHIFSSETNMGPLQFGLRTYAYQPLSPFWFLYALFVANIALFACRSLARTWILLLTTAGFIAGQMVPLDIVQLTTWGLLYFCLGLCLADWVRQPRFAQAISRPLGLLALFCTTILVSLFMSEAAVGSRFEFPVAITGSALIFGLAAALARAEHHWRVLRIISFLGRISLTVLVVHVLGTAGTRILLTKGLHVHLAWLHLTVGTLVGLAIPLLLQLACARMGLLRPFGLPVLQPVGGMRYGWPRRPKPINETAA